MKKKAEPVISSFQDAVSGNQLVYWTQYLTWYRGTGLAGIKFNMGHEYRVSKNIFNAVFVNFQTKFCFQ